MNELWYLYRNPRTSMELKVMTFKRDRKLLKRLGLRLKGYKLMNIVDPVTVNKGAK
jgi:hypothetical protein